MRGESDAALIINLRDAGSELMLTHRESEKFMGFSRLPVLMFRSSSRPEGAAIYQPRAAPWELQRRRIPSPERAAQTADAEHVRQNQEGVEKLVGSPSQGPSDACTKRGGGSELLSL